MNWIRKIMLKSFKKRALLEVRTDLRFITIYRKHELNYHEEDGRKILRTQTALPENKQSKNLIDSTSRLIAQHLATKKEHEQLTSMEKDLIKYIELL